MEWSLNGGFWWWWLSGNLWWLVINIFWCKNVKRQDALKKFWIWFKTIMQIGRCNIFWKIIRLKFCENMPSFVRIKKRYWLVWIKFRHWSFFFFIWRSDPKPCNPKSWNDPLGMATCQNSSLIMESWFFGGIKSIQYQLASILLVNRVKTTSCGD